MLSVTTACRRQGIQSFSLEEGEGYLDGLSEHPLSPSIYALQRAFPSAMREEAKSCLPQARTLSFSAWNSLPTLLFAFPSPTHFSA